MRWSWNRLERLGAVSGLKSALINNIETDHSDYRERARKVLQKWKKKRKWGNSWNSHSAILTSRLVNNAYELFQRCGRSDWPRVASYLAIVISREVIVAKFQNVTEEVVNASIDNSMTKWTKDTFKFDISLFKRKTWIFCWLNYILEETGCLCQYEFSKKLLQNGFNSKTKFLDNSKAPEQLY